MSLVPVVVGTVAAANAADIGISGRILIYIAASALFGLIGLVPLLGDKPATRRRSPDWTIVDAGSPKAATPDTRISEQGLTIDGEVREIKERLAMM